MRRFLRQQAIREILRIVKKNGVVLIYVWAFEQEERTFTEQDIFVPWNLQLKFEDESTIQDLSAQKEPGTARNFDRINQFLNF